MKQNEKSKILFYDLECSSLDANFGYIICIGYKWNYEKKAHVMSISDFPLFKKDPTNDSQLLEGFRKVWDQADITIGHYSSKFDLPFLQTRYLMNGLQILPESSSVDTWRIAKYKLKLNSNRLETILQALNCKYHKTPVNGKYWVKAIAGNRDAIKYIVDHCYSDVMVLEEVYEKIKGLLTNHPLVGKPKEFKQYTVSDECPTCGKKEFRVYGTSLTATKRFQRLKCFGCGRVVKGKVYNEIGGD